MTKHVRLAFVGGGAAAAALLLAGPAGARTPAFPSDVPDRFHLEIGAFRIGADTELAFRTAGGPHPPVSFEGLNLPGDTTRLYVEGFWRPGRRHQLSLSWYRNDREGDPRAAERSFPWGDRVITVGTTVRARVGSDYLSGAYRFAAYKSARFEIGPSVGLGYLWLEAGLAGQAGAAGPEGEASRPFDVSRSLGQPTGDLGGYLYWWPIPRLLLRGDLRYILVEPESAEASITDGRAAAILHPLRHLGVGVQYSYTRFRYDRGLLSTELGGRLRYRGWQLVVTSAF
jgi:hypothetical protein